MSWDKERSNARVADHDFAEFEVSVADLSRTMDFHNLSTKDVRRVQGVHIYVDMPDFHAAVKDADGDPNLQKELLRAASVLRKLQRDALKDLEVAPVQTQAARIHALVFRPYDDEAERARVALAAAVTMKSILAQVVNPVFPEMRNLRPSIGIAGGQSYIANVGFRGDRELIALGTCANLAAKALGAEGTLTVSKDVWSLLAAEIQEHFERSRTISGIQTFQAEEIDGERGVALQSALAVEFNVDKWIGRAEKYRSQLDLDDMSISEPRKMIDLEELTERNSKSAMAVAIYADLDGFTKYVQDAEADGEIVGLVRILHMIRHELHAVIKQDYPGVVLQHQGDRTFAILHLHSDEGTKPLGRKGLALAIGLQSSMVDVINERLGDRKDIHLAVGMDLGRVLVSRLGKKGSREVICLGTTVTCAERLQLLSSGGDIRISDEIHEGIQDETLRNRFKRHEESNSFVARSLTFKQLDMLQEEAAARQDTLSATAEGKRIHLRTRERPESQRTVIPKPWRSA